MFALVLPFTIACADSSPHVPDETAVGFRLLVEQQIEHAYESEASADQIELLEASLRDGVVTPEVFNVALNAFGRCLEDSGLDFQVLAPTGSSEFPLFHYEVHTTSEAGTMVMDQCSIQHLRFVDSAYQRQPAFDAARSALVLSKRDDIVACLDGEGVAIAADATVEELKVALLTGVLGQDPREPASSSRPGPFYDCLGPVGLTLTDMMGELDP